MTTSYTNSAVASKRRLSVAAASGRSVDAVSTIATLLVLLAFALGTVAVLFASGAVGWDATLDGGSLGAAGVVSDVVPADIPPDAASDAATALPSEVAP